MPLDFANLNKGHKDKTMCRCEPGKWQNNSVNTELRTQCGAEMLMQITICVIRMGVEDTLKDRAGTGSKISVFPNYINLELVPKRGFFLHSIRFCPRLHPRKIQFYSNSRGKTYLHFNLQASAQSVQ